MMVRRVPELVAGFVVIIVAALFLLYALRGAGEVNTGGYLLRAQFGSIGGLSVGSNVKIAGVIVGHVASETLNPVTYAAEITMTMDNRFKIPVDSSATIASDGLLGGPFVSISPGGSEDMMKSGSVFQVTQSAINIEDLIGKFIFSMGGSHSQGQGGGNTSSSSSPDSSSSGNPAMLPQ